MSVNEPAVLTEGLTKKFRGKTVLDGVDLEVPRGSVFALLGPNGAGKTTTIKLIFIFVDFTGRKPGPGLHVLPSGPPSAGEDGYLTA